MAKPQTYKTEAIILRHFDLGEADRILTIYTPYMGKLRAVARGARRLTSRLGGHVEPIMHCSLALSSGRNLDVVNQSQTIESFRSIRSNLWTTAQALYCVELVDTFTTELVENYPVFRLLLDTLHELATGHATQILLRYFELHFIGHIGYRPELQICLDCRSEIKPVDNYFSASAGGVLCPNCSGSEPTIQPISVNALKVLRLIQSGDYGTSIRLRLNKDMSRELAGLMQGYIRYLLERELKSTRFLDRLVVEGMTSDRS